ncbi:metallophosphoesterase [Qipengyuania proteolytica]|uniref:metallophosphoesterase n=1 Tax=Qipengyuania proteolytica TaxID=2867239 RepID=UPI0031EF25B0
MKADINRASRKARWSLAVIALLASMLGAKAWSDTLGDPVVHRTSVATAALPAGARPITVALISDIHVAGPDMPPARLEEIVAQINALDPDIVAIAGDLVSERRTATHIYTPEEIVAPLAALTPRLGTVVVPGNHDHWYDMPALAAQLERYGIPLVANSAIRLGPLVIGGLDDAYTRREDIPETLVAMDKLGGGAILLSHSPDPAADAPEGIDLVLAGHTHCGQIAYPWGGAPAHFSDYGDRYACGRIDEGKRTVIVGAGLGTSLMPVRLFTKPEIWLVEVTGKSEPRD